EAYQRACISLARHGFVVLCYDPIGQGERYQVLDAQGRPRIRSSTAEHTLVGVAALLVGSNTATFRIWDGIRALDYLASRPEVDARRLGCTGNSGGGTLTAYLMALDDRIQVAAPSCYLTSLERLFETIGPQDAEQNITGQVVFGLEHADYVTLRAPKPTLILTATRDFFDIRGSWETFREAKRLYCILGYGERVELAEFPTPHGFHRGQREAMLRWMRRWLQQRDEPVTEPEGAVFTEAQVQCTRTGQVLEDFKGLSVFDILEAETQRLRALREKSGRRPQENLAQVKKLVAWREPQPAKTVSVRTGTLRRWLETEPGIVVPVQIVQREPGKEITLCVVEHLTQLEAVQRELAQHGLQLDGTLLVMTPRGLGEKPIEKPTGMGLIGPDWKEAFLALHLNRPLLGQRAFDVVSVLGAIRRDYGDQPVHLVGVARCGPVVLHAAAFDNKVDKITIFNSLASWEMISRERISIGQLANVVPGALAIYDLPELAASLAPRRLAIVAPVHADGSLCDAQLAERVYRGVAETYRQAQAASRFQLVTPSKK
ncbi:MAG: prolyl oligopeptidase family serine peptidase, partial [Gemmatales bacterium]|nr:prolyl oligopeptidase family serine peptidase [Gemmatales bacterium]MDW8175841.1 prolyl oligopeptidase family serine peptidase [Gemmatales bacterium]